MTYEILMLIALWCGPMTTDSYLRREQIQECRKHLIACIEKQEAKKQEDMICFKGSK